MPYVTPATPHPLHFGPKCTGAGLLRPMSASREVQKRFWSYNSDDMDSLRRFFFEPATGPAAIFLVRLAVGLIFFTQGILKFTDPNMGVARFARIGFSHPAFTAHFVGVFEILCGILVLLGVWTRIASLPLLIIISTAIATTKLPELSRPNQGFWFMVSDARTDFAMLCSLIFLIVVGAGVWSVDAHIRARR